MYFRMLFQQAPSFLSKSSKIRVRLAVGFFAVLLSPLLDGFDQLYSAFLCSVLLLSINTATSGNFSSDLKLRSRNSNPGRLGVKRDCYLCAMLTTLSC